MALLAEAIELLRPQDTWLHNEALIVHQEYMAAHQEFMRIQAELDRRRGHAPPEA